MLSGESIMLTAQKKRMYPGEGSLFFPITNAILKKWGSRNRDHLNLPDGKVTAVSPPNSLPNESATTTKSTLFFFYDAMPVLLF
jgi:hypothetical protein